MDLTQAIQAIAASALEHAEEITEALRNTESDLATAQQQVEDLTNERDKLVENNSRLLGQKGAATARVKELEDRIAALVQQVAEEGEDQEAALERLQNLTEELKQTQTNLATVEKERDVAIAEKSALQESLTYQKAATKLGLPDSLLLERLLELPADRIVVNDDGVLVKAEDSDKTQSFDDFLETQPETIKRVVKLAISGDKEADSEPPQPRPAVGPKAPPADSSKPSDTTAFLKSAGFTGPPALSKA
jgi:DNA repair exonuclease SbcCD ATPase subunit